ncbi:MAG: hypothetical protein KIT36_02735 [Alphaproteobacteria bacterium]|nr:hypothetical protein [Alphaproteobacteria bacterium]
MRTRDLGTDLVVDDNPVFDRWIGGFNFVVAMGCAAIGVIHYNPAGDLRDVFLILIVPFAVVVAGLGLWRAVAQPGTILHVDGVGRTVTLVNRTLLRRITTSWPAAEVARFARAQRPGREGEPVYRLRLDFVDGGSLPAATLWQPDPAGVDAVVQRANALLGK